MDDQTSMHTTTLIGWLVAALAAAWGWIVKRMIVGRMDDIERDLARKAEAIVTYVADKVALGQVKSVTLDEVAAAYPY